MADKEKADNLSNDAMIREMEDMAPGSIGLMTRNKTIDQLHSEVKELRMKNDDLKDKCIQLQDQHIKLMNRRIKDLEPTVEHTVDSAIDRSKEFTDTCRKLAGSMPAFSGL